MAIKIKAKNKGKFTASAKKAGQSVQAHAHSVMNNPNSTPLQRKRANFAIQAKKWNHKELGGYYEEGGGQNWDNLSDSQKSQPIQGFGQSQSVGDYLNTSFTGLGNSVGNIINYNPQTTQMKQNTKAVQDLNKFNKASTSTGTKVGRGIGIAALNFVPFVGPMLAQYGSQAVDKMVDKRREQLQAKADSSLQGLNGNYEFTPMIQNMQNNPVMAKNGGSLRSMSKYANGGTNQAVYNPTGNPFDTYRFDMNDTAFGKVAYTRDNGTRGVLSREEFNKIIKENTGNSKLEFNNNLNEFPIKMGNDINSPSFNNGGELETYNLPLHKNINPNLANATLDTKPVQINAKETIFRKENGGDYVFSDSLKKDNKTFAEHSKKTENKLKRPYYDPIASKTKEIELGKLQAENDIAREKVESKKNGVSFPMYAKNGRDGREIPFTENQPRLYDFNNQEEPIEMTSMQPSLLQSNSSLQPTLTKYSNTSLPAVKQAKTSSNNLATGDYLQLAGMVPSLAYNTARAFEKPEVQKLHADRSSITEQQIAKDYNPSYLALNSAYKAIDEGSSSDALRRASKISALSQVVPQLQAYGLNVDTTNKGLKSQYEDKVSNQRRFNIGNEYLTDDINARNRATTRSFGAAAATQLGQGLTNFGVAKNQGKTNEIEYSTLQSLAANYGLDPKEYGDFLKSKGVKIVYKK